MSVLDDLIRIKTKAQEDDLLKLLDEVPVYEKLSVDEKLKDLKNSEITRSKCPFLAAFADGKLYETILAELAANVYMQIEGQIPEVLQIATERSLKQQKQMDILQSGVTRVEYCDLMEYDHETMEPFLAAVFTSQHGESVTAALIVKHPHGYRMYHGIYTVAENVAAVRPVSMPLTVKGKNGLFSMETYSVLGNNGYRFATYANKKARYDVMIGPDNVLYLIDGRMVVTYSIPLEENNLLNMSKKDPREFAEAVTHMIEIALSRDSYKGMV